MRARSWSQPTSWDVVCRRAAGRARFNSLRTIRADHRRFRLLQLANDRNVPLTGYGVKTMLAAELGVDPSTISRDVQRIYRDAAMAHRCPVCGTPT